MDDQELVIANAPGKDGSRKCESSELSSGRSPEDTSTSDSGRGVKRRHSSDEGKKKRNKHTKIDEKKDRKINHKQMQMPLFVIDRVGAC